MARQRVDALLESAVRHELVYVVAGTGYGKTQAVWNHIASYPDAVVRWVQLTESDNIGSRYWEKFAHIISHDNPEYTEKLRELGFPDTLARFKQFASITEALEHSAHRMFIVFDDFYLIRSEKVLKFMERCAYFWVAGSCMIIISRNEPAINAVSLFAKGKACVVTEDALRFTDDEIAAFLKQKGIGFSCKNLPAISEATKGWALAIQLLSLMLKRSPDNFDLAMSAMKQNVFKLIGMEAFDDFPENDRKAIVKLALVSDLPSTSLHELFDDLSFIDDTPQLASFMWLDSFAGGYKVHPLYLEFLKNKRCILTASEKQNTYKRAAKWCVENNFHMDAVFYFAKIRQYERILELFLSYPYRLPQDMAEYFLGILDGMKARRRKHANPALLVLKNIFAPLLLTSLGRYNEAKVRSLAAIEEWRHDGGPLAKTILFYSHINLAYVDIFLCVTTHRYEMPGYLKKCVEHKELAIPPATRLIGPLGCPDVRSFACLVGEGANRKDFDRFVEAAKQASSLIAEAGLDLYYGYGDLAACEFAFFRNKPDLARAHALQAISKAHEKSQHSVEAMAKLYLLRISMQEGDLALARETLKQLQEQLKYPDFWSRRLLYDLFTGYFYAQIEIPEMVPRWLVANESDILSDVHIPNIELFICAKCYMALNKYTQVLSVLSCSVSRDAHERFLLGELTFALLAAVARLKTGDTAGAIADFERAWRLSFDGEFEMPFVELGKNLHPLTKAVAASEQERSGIAKDWLKAIDLKASVYAKKVNRISNAFKKEKNIESAIRLSQRELQALNDLYHGLSREEMAANRYLSINTVKKILQSLYIKLDANNNVDAIRIAIEKKLI